jgi:Activator of Hsp90 ATPase homolog 1-like protein
MPEPAVALAIRKSVAVAAPVETAFRVFIAELGAWWPLASKSVSQEQAETVIVEPRVGGRVYERARSGEEHAWGEVLVWEPSSRFAFSWHPGRSAETSQEVDVRFTSVDSGTRVDLEHRGWERLVGPGGEIPEHFDSGWDEALASYVELAERSR